MDSFVQEVNSNHMQYTSRFIFFYSITTYNVSKNFQLRRLMFLFFLFVTFFPLFVVVFLVVAFCCFYFLCLDLLAVVTSPCSPCLSPALFQYSVDTRGIDLTSFIFNCVGSNHQIFETNICKLFANAERIEDEIQDVSFFLFTAEKVHINPSYIAAIGVYIKY